MVRRRAWWLAAALAAVATIPFWKIETGRKPVPAESRGVAAFPVPGDRGESVVTADGTEAVPPGRTEAVPPGRTPAMAADPSWPQPEACPIGGRVAAYRSRPGKALGHRGECEVREWLMVPDEGYVTHVTERRFPKEDGSGVTVESSACAAGHVIVRVDAAKSLDRLRERLAGEGVVLHGPLMTAGKGARLMTAGVAEPTLDSVAEIRKILHRVDPNLRVDNDGVGAVSRTPTDSRFNSQWGMNRIGAPLAWERVTDASDVVVAVIDSGIRTDHEDFQGNLVAGMSCIGGNRASDVSDAHGHGTHCAGTIGAVGNNGRGVAGVAWRVKLMPLRTIGSNGCCFDSDNIVCMDYAREHGAKVVNCSWGGAAYNASVEAAIRALGEAGAIVVCSAGNNERDIDQTPYYPASYRCDNVIAVASLSANDELSTFSNYGAEGVDIAAPGENILSTGYLGPTAYSTMSGTSAAAPHVTGALALLRAVYPDYTGPQLIRLLCSRGDSVPACRWTVSSGCCLDVDNALGSGKLAPPGWVEATHGDSNDCVCVEWGEVDGATHYRVSRSNRERGERMDLSGWITACAYVDRDVGPGTNYYYFVEAATSASGENRSDCSDPASGYAQRTTDQWDHGDDTRAGATPLELGDDMMTHGPHVLHAGMDTNDWFKIEMRAGSSYVFESSGVDDTYAELYDGDGELVAEDDDGWNDYYDLGRNFRLEFSPEADGTFYLRVRCYDEESMNASYSLKCLSERWSDDFDPDDDEPDVAKDGKPTPLEPTETDQYETGRKLGAKDLADWYVIEMTEGMVYTFFSEGVYDTYGELFDAATTNLGNRVAYNDDDSDFNFRLNYIAERSGTYFLRVRGYSPGDNVAYTLGYSANRWTDEWDPGDDVAAGATVLAAPTADGNLQTGHTLGGGDTNDWFRIRLEAGKTYYFSSANHATEVGWWTDTYGALHLDPDASPLAEDDDSAGDMGFSIAYRPERTGDYYLHVGSYRSGDWGVYDLEYGLVGDDAWDPADDTPEGATLLAPTETEQEHGPHILFYREEEDDRETVTYEDVDCFAIDMTAGVTYVFDAMPIGGTYIYGSLQDALGNEVDWSSMRPGCTPGFFIAYTAPDSGRYYLRASIGGDGMSAYRLRYWRQREALDLVFYEEASNEEALCMLTKDGEYPCDWFVAGENDYEEIRVFYTFMNKLGQPVETPFTNRVCLLDASGREVVAWEDEVTELHKFEYLIMADDLYDYIDPEDPLLPTNYVLRVELNRNLAGDHSLAENNYDDNVMEFPFTVIAPEKRVTAVAIDGPDVVQTGDSNAYVCTAKLIDGSSETVRPEWSCDEGCEIDADGNLVVREAGLKRIIASYRGLHAVRHVQAVAASSGSGSRTAPFPKEADIFPSMPMIIRAEIRINGELAQFGDVLAAYATPAANAAEQRFCGSATVDANGRVLLVLYLPHYGEQLTFRVWDADAPEGEDLFDCMQSIVGNPGGHWGSGSKPEELDAATGDPFGTQVVEPNVPAVIRMETRINDDYAPEGSIVGAFDESKRLVGKQVVRDLGDGRTGCLMTLYLDGAHELTFKVFVPGEGDAGGKMWKVLARPAPVIAPGEFLGSAADRYVVRATDRELQVIDLGAAGYHRISFWSIPTNASPEEVFKDIRDDIISVTTIDGRSWPGRGENGFIEEILPGVGYGVRTRWNSRPFEVEGYAHPETEIRLNAGEWTRVGFTLKNPGRIEAVLRTAIEDGLIDGISCGDDYYPHGTLKRMEPGKVYDVLSVRGGIIRFDDQSMAGAAVAEASGSDAYCGPFGAIDEGLTTDYPESDETAPTFFMDFTVTLFGHPAKNGDCVAVFDRDGNCYGKVVIDDEELRGRATIGVWADADRDLLFKVWSSSSPESMEFVYPAEGVFHASEPAPDGSRPAQAGLEIKVTEASAGAVPTFTVTFDLNGKAERTGGGELEQRIAFGQAVTLPELRYVEGRSRDYYWSEEGRMNDVRSSFTTVLTLSPSPSPDEQSPENPDPEDPTPEDPTPVDPTPVDPTPVDPTPVDPTPVDPDPEDPDPVDPTPTDPVLIKDPTKGDVKDNMTYSGWFEEKSTVAASFSVKISKAKDGKAKATMTVQPVRGKKYALKGTVDMKTGKGEGALEGLEFGASGVAGKIDGQTVVGAIGAGKNGDPVLAKLDAFSKKVGAVAIDTPDGVATMTLTFSKKGKVKVAGTLGSGTKVSLSCQAVLGDTQIAVPVADAKKGFSYVVWFDSDAKKFKVKSVGELPAKWNALAFGTAGGVKTGEHVFSVDQKDVKAVVKDVLVKLLPEQEKFAANGSKFVFDKACKVDKLTGEALGDKKNPAGVKVTYKDTAGTLKGSFGVWTMVNGKAKKTSVTVTGVAIDGVGYGTGVIKKSGSFPVDIK